MHSNSIESVHSKSQRHKHYMIIKHNTIANNFHRATIDLLGVYCARNAIIFECLSTVAASARYHIDSIASILRWKNKWWSDRSINFSTLFHPGEYWYGNENRTHSFPPMIDESHLATLIHRRTRALSLIIDTIFVKAKAKKST